MLRPNSWSSPMKPETGWTSSRMLFMMLMTLLDEFNTITQQQEQKARGKNKISQKVQRFFSRSKRLLFPLSTSLDIKKIKKKLDAIASDHTKFGLGVDHQSIWKRREETCSHVYEERIIGRDSDKEELVGMLLNSDVEQDVSFVTIVGIGGLGKTTLAQIVYNDDRIKSEFQVRLWVCVSDEFGVKEILGKMLKSLSANENCHGLVLDQLQSKVREHIEAYIYLLVLDDVWEESHDAWVKLKDFLVRGRRESKVVVTSRSKNVVRAIGNHPMYELQGLSEEHTWQLFKLMAFDSMEEQHVDANLSDIGKDIVKKCTNVPLSIRVIGSLLYGQDIDKWLLFQKNDLVKIKEAKDSTMAILKFSYCHLTPSLKSCFSYCALFPKDYRILKNLLIELWLANGCIVPRYEDQSIEDVGNEYFSILLQRCFFQDISEYAYYGGIASFKVHDLMHDLASEAAGHESVILSPMTSHLDYRIRHLSIFEERTVLNSPFTFSTNMKTMRTFLQLSRELCPSNATRISSFCTRLRWLDLRGASLDTLPSGLGRLIHLRYLNLSDNRKLKILPESITNLHNVHILKLASCWKLLALPKHFSRLVNLRHLDIDCCSALTHMPTGLKNLTCLQRLSTFVVGGDSEEDQMSQLEDLKALTNLTDKLTIKVVKLYSNQMSKVKEGAYLLNKPHLKHLDVKFWMCGQCEGDFQEALLEGLQPNCKLLTMYMDGYKGVKLAGWLLQENKMRASLSHLVQMNLMSLDRVQHLPPLSQLRHLKQFTVIDIPNLEFVESDSSHAPLADSTFFPSLELLKLQKLPKLKGWWRDGVMVDMNAHGSESDGVGCSKTREQDGGDGCGISSLFLFPHLHFLAIDSCENMRSFPPCPSVKSLSLIDLNGIPLFTENRAGAENHNHINGLCTTAGSSVVEFDASCTAEDSSCVIPPIFALEKLRTSNASLILGLPKESVRGLVSLEFKTYDESLSGIRDVFRSCASSLQVLENFSSPNLKSLFGGGIEHLTCLQKLTIRVVKELDLEEEDENGMPWKSLHNLSSLTLKGLPKLVNLPKGLEYLTALQSLTIGHCDNLTALPKWFSCLTSLQSLDIEYCRTMTLSEAKRNLPSHAKLNFVEAKPNVTYVLM